MDAKEAINILAKMQNYDSKRNVEALEIAIEALEKVPTLEAENARLKTVEERYCENRESYENQVKRLAELTEEFRIENMRLKEVFASGQGASEIGTERLRQIYSENFDSNHDSQWTHNELIRAATCYLKLDRERYYPAVMEIHGKKVPAEWPPTWDVKWWKPGVHRRNLIKAGALIAAEIDRLDKQAIKIDKE